MTAFDEAAPAWMRRWHHVVPHPERPWVVSDGRCWALLDPATGNAEIADPHHDRALPALAPALARGALVAYRPGRRAVVRIDAAPGRHARFVKIVRAGAAPEVRERHRLAAAAPGYRSPTVLDADDVGRIELSSVDGVRLHDALRLRFDVATRRAAELATLLAAVRDTPLGAAPADAVLDDPARWIRVLERVEPAAADHASRVARTLPEVSVAGTAAVHGDLHDKNLVVGATGEPWGVIDLDGLARGAAELDVANLAVHLVLRALLAGRPASDAMHAGDRLVHACVEHGLQPGHDPVDPERVRDLARHTAFRLACLYRCRPQAPRPASMFRLASGTGWHLATTPCATT
ncbi:MAG: hypothetical protein R2713_13710 [Ilumatobacteraceae bacterium]